MKKRCQDIGCKKLSETYTDGKYLCREHRCRCNENPATAWFEGCHIHKKR